MATTLEGVTNRLSCNASSRVGVLDDISGENLLLLKGVEAQIQCALFNDTPSSDSFITSTVNVFGVDLWVRRNSPTGTVLLHKTLNGSAVNDITYANWLNGSAHQFEFELTSIETNQTTPSDGTQRIFFYIVVTTDVKTYVAAFGVGQIQDVGVTNVSLPVPLTFTGVFVDGNGVVQNPAIDFTGVVLTGLDFGLGGLIVDSLEVEGDLIAEEFHGDGADITNVVASNVNHTLPGAGGVSRTLAARLNKIIDVEDYGGSTASSDNVVAIDNAITAAGANGAIRFSKGTWITSRVNITTANLTILGDGQGSTVIKKKDGATSSTSSTVFLASNTATGLTLRDITFDGNRANQGAYENIAVNSVLFIGGSGSTIENCEIKNSCFTGIYVSDELVLIIPDRVTIRNCWIHDNGGVLNSSGNGVGIHASVATTRLLVTGCTVENNYNTITKPNDSSGMNLVVGSGSIITNNFLKNNYNVAGGQLAVNGPAIISNNTLEITGTFGTPADLTAGIEINGADFAVVGNNILSYHGGSGIVTAGASGVGHGTIIGNVIKGGPVGAAGIVLYGNQTDPITAVAVTGNHVKATYGIGLNNVNTNINVTGNDFGESTNIYAVAGGVLDPTVIGDIFARPLVAYVPVVTSGSGSITSYTVTGFYLRTGNLVFIEITITIVTNGTAATDIRATLPFQASSLRGCLFGYEDAINGSALKAKIPASTSLTQITKSVDNTYMGGDGAVLFVSGTYEATP